jgi:predicted amidophosphoribosyltransferase
MSAPPATLLSDKTTWAKRNALQKIQPSREPARKLTDAEKASRQLAAGLKKQNQMQLNEAVGAYILERSTKLQELADMHNVKVAKIEEMVNASTHYKKARTPSLANAIVHHLAKTVNEG